MIKAFDLVHARFPTSGAVELWLGELKLYTNANAAITDAIKSVSGHIDKGFLTSQKLFLGPQIPKTTSRYDEILELFRPQTSLDRFLSSAVFVVGILCDSKACKGAKEIDNGYRAAIATELAPMLEKLNGSGLSKRIRMLLVYVPLGSKEALVKAFDTKLKALQ